MSTTLTNTKTRAKSVPILDKDMMEDQYEDLQWSNWSSTAVLTPVGVMSREDAADSAMPILASLYPGNSRV